MRRRSLVPAVLLAAVAAVNFLWMPGEFLAGDPHAWREETRSMLLAGELNVREAFVKLGTLRGQYFAQNESNNLYYSKYGIANSLLALPPMWLDRALGGVIAERGVPPSLLLSNLWNLALGVALAALLYALSGRYSRRAGVRVLFVIAAFYCTSLWFYLRAQSSEIYQTLFFTALFMALIGFLRRLRERGPGGLDRRAWLCLAVAWLFAALLFFTRVLYGLLFPLIVLLGAWCASRGRTYAELRPGAVKLAAALLVPPLLTIALLGFVNHVKFGAPWLSGYHQWRLDLHVPGGRLADGLWGFLLSPRYSIFLYFPLLIFALVALRRFIERHLLDAVVMLSIFGAYMVVTAKFPSWAGEWTYGPRYLLPLLPVLSLPFLTFADDVLDRIGTWRARAWGAIAVAGLAFSAYLQVQMNLLPFWAYYTAQQAVFLAPTPDTIEYLLNRHNGLLAADMVRHRYRPDALPYFAEVRQFATPAAFAAYRSDLGLVLERSNLYWSLPREQRR
jgi:MFS family permease